MRFGTEVLASLPYDPNDGQMLLIAAFAHFLLYSPQQTVFLLKGYAGTGKTSMTGALVKTMSQNGMKAVLMAPTGRAAKVFTEYSGHTAYTIHRKIYRQQSYGQNNFLLAENKHTNTVFIVDEASMISNSSSDYSVFGTGRLLDDLIEFVYTGDNCRLILIGDTAQLPPVMQPFSPALDRHNLERYGLDVTTAELTEVARQSADSGILYNATTIRHVLTQAGRALTLNHNFPDVHRITGAELIDEIQSAYSRSGVENCIIVTRSNKRAVLYNRGIRNQVMCKEDELSAGDLLLITRNNYFWSKEYPDLEFIANGDVAELVRIKRYHDMYGLRFVDVTLRFLDYDCEIDTRLLIDSLYTETPAAAEQLAKKLFAAVEEDYLEIGNRRTRYKAMMQNEYLNALQVKFGYAVTCHKAQGGQWSEVFIDQGGLTPEQIDTDYLRWLYTACTRAEKNLFFINFSDQFFD